MNTSEPLQAFVIDDQPVIAAGIRLALDRMDEFKFSGSAQTIVDAFAYIESNTVDVLVVDLILDGSVDLSLIESLRDAVPDCFIVVFSSLPAENYHAPTLAAGADHYVAKSEPLETLIGNLLAFAATRKKPEVPAAGLAYALNIEFEGVILTDRECDIAMAIGQGLPVSQIADRHEISPKTVAAHRDNIRKKFGFDTSVQLSVYLSRALAKGSR